MGLVREAVEELRRVRPDAAVGGQVVGADHDGAGVDLQRAQGALRARHGGRATSLRRP